MVNGATILLSMIGWWVLMVWWSYEQSNAMSDVRVWMCAFFFQMAANLIRLSICIYAFVRSNRNCLGGIKKIEIRVEYIYNFPCYWYWYWAEKNDTCYVYPNSIKF